MATIGTIHDLIRFHTIERHLFTLLIGRMRKPIFLTKIGIALWLLLEEIGFYDLNQTIFESADFIVDAIFDETISCLDCMDPINYAEPRSTEDIPFLAQILNEQVNRRFFYFNRNVMLNRVYHIMNTICAVIFNGITSNEVKDIMVHPVVAAIGEGSSTQGAILRVNQAPIRPLSAEMNPFARQFTMGKQSTPQCCRSLFLTFSNGFPLSREEIIHVFTSQWGPVVEDVIIERSPHGITPNYGCIDFTNASVVENVLNGKQKVKFIVNRRHLWARVFVPKGTYLKRHQRARSIKVNKEKGIVRQQ